MKKLFLFLLISISFSKFSFSQTNELIVESEGGKLFLNHTVTPKENWYSIGRLFNISPKDIAPFNGVTIDKPLSIGEHIKIPLTAVNFAQNGMKAVDETFVALYHTSHDNETLAHISSSYNDVLVASLKKWNHFSAGKTNSGTQIIVGYLKVKPALSALASGGKNNIPETVVETKKENTTPVINNPPVVKQEKKPETVVEKPEPIVKQETKPVYTNTQVARHTSGSYFSAEYNEGNKSASGMAGVFKSTSGWQDGKYYALINNAPVGTIVKVISPTTNKSIYAKVLGPLPDMKESAGLAIRISNAAASDLGESDIKFTVEVRY
jgi:LysM repeat protein